MYGLIGKTLSHSFSEKYFSEKFLREGIKECYHLFSIDKIEDLSSLLTEYPDLKGLNITIPYKETVIPLLTDLSKDAKEIGAVNTVKILKSENSAILKGYNTDSYGFKKSLEPLLPSHNLKALIFGTGGASKAVKYVLKEIGIDFIEVSRNQSPNKLTYKDLTVELIKSTGLLINATPVGMYPDSSDCLPIPYSGIGKNHICYDLIYNPCKTEFLRRAERNGAKIKNGLEMLHLQAEKAWEIWES